MKMASTLKNSWTYIAVVVAAFVLRIVNISSPHVFQMDEVYYVRDAVSILRKGYEATWGAGDAAFKAFYNGTAQIVDPMYQATHPPLAKWIMSLGMMLFGTDNGLGWRFSTVVVGTITVALTMWIAHLMFNKKAITLTAGIMLAVSTLNIALSRTSHLDIYLTMFCLLAVAAVLKDQASNTSNGFWRPWLFTAAVAIGAAASCKWSGLYFAAILAIYIIVLEINKNKVDEKLNFKSLLSSLSFKALLVAPTIIMTYIITWTGWILNYGLDKAKGSLMQAYVLLAQEHIKIYNQISALNYKHNYNSNALEWFLAPRPTLLYDTFRDEGVNGCQFEAGCAVVTSSSPNLLLWWSAIVGLFVLILGLTYRNYDKKLWILPVAVIGLWLPWLQYKGRTIFEFYTVAFEPYLYIILAYLIYMAYQKSSDKKLSIKKTLIILFAMAALFISVIFYPGATSITQPKNSPGITVLNSWTTIAYMYNLYDNSQMDVQKPVTSKSSSDSIESNIEKLSSEAQNTDD